MSDPFRLLDPARPGDHHRADGEHGATGAGPRPPDPLATGIDPSDRVLARPVVLPGVLDRLGGLADATGVSPGRLAVGAATVLALVAAAVWALRPPASPPELDLPHITTTRPEPEVAPAAAPPVPSEPEPPGEVVVHVAGAVAAPGVHRLAPDARVVDAVAAAGGLADDADGARVNLAAPVADGERVYVPRVDEDDPPVPVAGVGPAGSAGDRGAGPGPGGVPAPVDLNRAGPAELEALPGVGPATAAAIVEHRDRIGGFTAVDQLLEVRGIGPAKLEQLRPHVTP